ncbi:hypothetical protein AJ78_08098 [Emergomyces pasteurianus Ep9510]|uniref:Uncharacterized protein n=1 Tax=Emergomyces pasteurianus Ep9510 TaxID=1447872 RepID=A0A1J9P2R4_9EURO|nr:hypothetical protein AJ78_08098 [Emergomyces pasteurianus Ep9510]
MIAVDPCLNGEHNYFRRRLAVSRNNKGVGLAMKVKCGYQSNKNYCGRNVHCWSRQTVNKIDASLHVGSLPASQHAMKSTLQTPGHRGLKTFDERDRPDAGNHILLGGSHHISSDAAAQGRVIFKCRL